MNKPISENEIAEARKRLNNDPKSLVELRPLPSVAMQVTRECRKPEVDTRALARLVEGDAAFALKILSVVNSSMYAFSREIVTIDQALVVLGRNSVAQLALSIAAQQVYSAGSQNIEEKMNLFKHSLAVASVARALIEKDSLKIDPGSAFLAGILHDIGKLAFFDVAPDTYAALINEPQTSAEIHVHETRLFGIDHTQLGKLFCDSWGLSGSISHVIEHHHSTEPDLPILTQTIALANQLSRHWGIGQPEIPCELPMVSDWLAENEASIEEAQQLANEHYYETKALLLG